MNSPTLKQLRYFLALAETGHFATMWRQLANRLGLEVDFVEGDWRHGADPEAIGARLAEDKVHEIKAVCVVHNETATGCTSRIADIRKAIDAARAGPSGSCCRLTHMRSLAFTRSISTRYAL